MSLPWTHNLADGETIAVKVFRDHPSWDTHEKWWQLPVHLVRELYVATYDVETPVQLAWVEEKYPGHVFVY
jgi:hypothetical protein